MQFEDDCTCCQLPICNCNCQWWGREVLADCIETHSHVARDETSQLLHIAIAGCLIMQQGMGSSKQTQSFCTCWE